MPSHKIHLAIAKKVNDKINVDLDSLMLGSVLPDLSIGKDHTKSHYQNGKLGVEGTANPDLFIKKYKDKLDNPVMIGYLLHLLTDKFYNTYAFTNFFIYDKDGNDIGLKFKGKEKILPADKVKYYKQREFGLYDNFLLNNGYVCKFNDFKCIDNVIDIDVATFDKEKLKNYIIEANNDIDKVNIFSKINLKKYKLTTKEELDLKFNECVYYILDYLKDKNINNNLTKYVKVMDGLKSNVGDFEYRLNEVNVSNNWNPTAKSGKDFGGFNYTTEDCILRWLHRGNTIYDVEIPKDAENIKIDGATTIYRTNKIIIKNPRKLDDDLALHFYKISNIPEKSYYKALGAVSIMNYKNTAYAIIKEKVNKDNIEEVLEEWNDFIFHGGKNDRKNLNGLVKEIDDLLKKKIR